MKNGSTEDIKDKGCWKEDHRIDAEKKKKKEKEQKNERKEPPTIVPNLPFIKRFNLYLTFHYILIGEKLHPTAYFVAHL